VGGPGLAGMSVPLVEPRTAGWRCPGDSGKQRAAARAPGVLALTGVVRPEGFRG
jgi:hypothetical protein